MGFIKTQGFSPSKSLLLLKATQLNILMLIKEVETIKSIKPLTPQQQRIDTLKQQVKRDQEAIKAERQRQKVAKAQQQLQKARTIKP
ncbi:hypothetical protein [Polynucleobacter sphagniphilus]|uniref:Uncharacterized protein n=1 Tax=Polynucleobacter sphagniphilus TaxID=1743169 RepID=A0AA43S562_9BURK|nr:hypothetical protein [Polynucleobacter sphagniphilus]MDH6504040.1 hypothetical protein [Polynucleobacter sphagniphilus]MDH6512532.1 hypothetical protein [Polynucleobacter sphagniphilus]